MTTADLYPEQDAEELGAYYMRHLDAMTREGLHKKSAIAGQLAWRDRRIEELEAALRAVAAHGTADQDGNHVCWIGESTFIAVRAALAPPAPMRDSVIDDGGQGRKE